METIVLGSSRGLPRGWRPRQYCSHLNTLKNWLDLKNQITVNNRPNFFKCMRVNNYKIGLSTMVNKLFPLKGKIVLNILNLFYPTYKKKVKLIEIVSAT